MNTQDFDLLTQEEIDAVVAEVLEEQGLGSRIGRAYSRAGKAIKQVGRDFKRGKDLEDAGVSDHVGAMDDQELADRAAAHQDVDKMGGGDGSDRGEFGREIDRRAGGANQQTGAQQGGAGGATQQAGGADGKWVGQGNYRGQEGPTARGTAAGTAGTPGMDVVDTKTGEKVDPNKVGGEDSIMPGVSGASADVVKQTAMNRTKAQQQGAAPNLALPKNQSVDPDDAMAAHRGDSAGDESGVTGEISMKGAWFDPGSSNLRDSIRKRVQQYFGDQMMGIDQVLEAYLKLQYDGAGDHVSIQKENARAHWIGVFRGLINRVQQQEEPELKASAEMAVKRQMDSLLNSVALFGAKRGMSPTEVVQTVATGGDDNGEPPGGGEESTEADPIPINKYPPRKIDPETGEPEEGKRAVPLRSLMSKSGLDQSTINTVMRALIKQLKAQNVPFTESLKNQLAKMVIERLLVKEVKNIMISEKGDPADFARMSSSDLTSSSDLAYDQDQEAEQFVHKKALMTFLKKLRKQSKIDFDPSRARVAIAKVLNNSLAGPSITVREAADSPSVIRLTDLHKALMKVPRASGEGLISEDDAYKLAKAISKFLEEFRGANVKVAGPGEDIEMDPQGEEEPPEEETPEEEPEQPGEKMRFDAVPDLFKKHWDKLTRGGKSRVGDMSAEEAWKNLPSGKVGKKRQNVAESLLNQNELIQFAKIAGLLKEAEGTATGIGKAAGRSVDTYGQQDGDRVSDVELTKVGWFKTQEDAPRMTSDKDLMTRNFEPQGSGNVEGNMKAFVGALVNKLAQNVKGRDAAEKGFGDDAYGGERGEGGGGSIKMSTMNQQLKANGVDKATRRQVMGIVQKHLQPYLKKHNLKLSEAQMEQLFGKYVTKLIENRFGNQD